MEQPDFAEYQDYARFYPLTKGVVIINGVINEGSSAVLQRDILMALQYRCDTLRIYITSPGGIVSETMAVHDTIRAVSSHGVKCYTIGMGLVASAACAILLQAGDRRYSYPNTRYMLHELSRSSSDHEKQSESMDVVAELKRIAEQMETLFCARTGVDVKRLRKATARKDLHLSAQEALEWGIVDEVTYNV